MAMAEQVLHTLMRWWMISNVSFVVSRCVFFLCMFAFRNFLFAIPAKGHTSPPMTTAKPFYVMTRTSISPIQLCVCVLRGLGVEKFSPNAWNERQSKKKLRHKMFLKKSTDYGHTKYFIHSHHWHMHIVRIITKHGWAVSYDFFGTNFKIHPSFSFNLFALIVQCCDQKR